MCISEPRPFQCGLPSMRQPPPTTTSAFQLCHPLICLISMLSPIYSILLQPHVSRVTLSTVVTARLVIISSIELLIRQLLELMPKMMYCNRQQLEPLGSLLSTSPVATSSPSWPRRYLPTCHRSSSSMRGR